MSDLNPYEESLAIDLATAQARIEELEAQLRVLLILSAYAEMEGDDGQDS